MLSTIMHTAISKRCTPGGVVAFGSLDSPTQCFAFGSTTYDPGTTRITEQSIFDAASLTKVMATTPAIMMLYEKGFLDIYERLSLYLPAFGNGGKELITVMHLLTHTAGLPAFYHFHNMGLRTKESIKCFLFGEKLSIAPGTVCIYSDLSMILLQFLVEELTGKDLNYFVTKELWNPLGMSSTSYLPAWHYFGDNCINLPRNRIVPTEVEMHFRHRLLWGEVHDPNAYTLNGVAGHAGVFTTCGDLAIYARLMLHKGLFNGRRYFSEHTVKLFTSRCDPTGKNMCPFAMGWDCRRPHEGYTSAGRYFSERAYGHTGFTGTSLWMDPIAGIFCVLLTNRVHPEPSFSNGMAIRALRPVVADACIISLVRLYNSRGGLKSRLVKNSIHEIMERRGSRGALEIRKQRVRGYFLHISATVGEKFFPGHPNLHSMCREELKFRCQVMDLRDTGSSADLADIITLSENDTLESTMNSFQKNRISSGLRRSKFHAQMHARLTAYKVAQYLATENYNEGHTRSAALIAPWSGRAREDGFANSHGMQIAFNKDLIGSSLVDIVHAHDVHTLPCMPSPQVAQMNSNYCRVRVSTLLLVMTLLSSCKL